MNEKSSDLKIYNKVYRSTWTERIIHRVSHRKVLTTLSLRNDPKESSPFVCVRVCVCEYWYIMYHKAQNFLYVDM